MTPPVVGPLRTAIAALALLLLVPVAVWAGAAENDFAARCAAPGVTKCVGWDSPDNFVPATGGGGYADGLYPSGNGSFQGSMDTSITASGAGSLRFAVPPGGDRNMSGYWLQSMGRGFDQGSTLYVQWRQRFSPEMMGHDWKQIIMYYTPGPSCTANLVFENIFGRNIPGGYINCSSPELATTIGGILYHQQGDFMCPHGGPYTLPNCFPYPVNKWTTFYLKVRIGHWGSNDSSVEAWVAVDGGAYQKFIDLPVFKLDQNPGEFYNTLQLTPYLADTMSTTGFTWYDELIVSTQPIAAPGAVAVGLPPAAPANLVVR